MPDTDGERLYCEGLGDHPHARPQEAANVVGIFPDEGSIVRLIGAVPLEANDEWQPQHRDMQTEAMADLTPPTPDADPPRSPPQPPDPWPPPPEPQFLPP